MLSAYRQEGLEFPEVFEAGDDHGFGWLGGRTLGCCSPYFQCAILSLFIHIAVLSLFVTARGNADSVRTPWLEVQLVSLGSGEIAPGSGEEGPAGGSPVMGAPAAGSPSPTELLPPDQPPTAVEKPREKDSKPALRPAAAQPRPVNKPKETARVMPLPKEVPLPETASDMPVQPADAGASEVAPGQRLWDAGESGSAAAGSAQGRGFRGGAGGGPIDAEFGTANGPRFVRRKMPQYPRMARQLGKEGTVVLRVTIDENGRPTAVETIKTAGSAFDEEAIKAVKESLFQPAKREGKPVICRAILPIRFELTGSD